MVRRSKRVVLTDRDIKLFNFLFINKIATIEQIRVSVFNNIHIRNVYSRLSRLIAEKYIQNIAYNGKRGLKRAYAITFKAYNLFIKESIDSSYEVQLKSDSLMHDLALVEIRSKLLNLKMVNRYFTENQLYTIEDSITREALIPFIECRTDGAARIRINDDKFGYVGIEFELSLKSKERCIEKVQNYYLRHDIGVVLFICASKPILNRFIDIEKNIQPTRRHKLFISDLDNVLNIKKEITFTNYKGAKFVLK